ncbi:IS6 family transposase [Rhizobium laguerreae]|nr:IS6 family transposase [Rhizobium laguerreae]
MAATCPPKAVPQPTKGIGRNRVAQNYARPRRPNPCWEQGCLPRRIDTDKLRSYGAARRHAMPTVDHRSHKGLNNSAENSHLPLQKRQRMMQRFGSPGALQRFTNIFSAVRNLVVPSHSTRSAIAVRLHRPDAFAQ